MTNRPHPVGGVLVGVCRVKRGSPSTEGEIHMSDEKFKMPLSSYEELTKVIKAYSGFSEPTDLDAVSKLIGVHRTIISRNAGFLTAIGILEPGAKKTLSARGRKLAHALEHNMRDDIRALWQEIVTESDFLMRLLAAVRIRSGMDQQTLEAHIVYSAGQPKRPQFMTGARTVIDILVEAELIKDVEGKYIGAAAKSAVPGITTSDDRISLSSMPVTPEQQSVGIAVPPLQAKLPGLVLHIQININCAAAEVPDLVQNIKKLVNELSMSGKDKITDEPSVK